jgi:hypothetical protein
VDLFDAAPASDFLLVTTLQSFAGGNDVPAPVTVDNAVGTPGGVQGLNLDKEICTGVTPNVKGDSRFADYYLAYGNAFNKASKPPCSLPEPACSPHAKTHFPSADAGILPCTVLACSAPPWQAVR